MSVNYNLKKKKESRRGSNRGPSAYQPSALSPGQTAPYHLARHSEGGKKTRQTEEEVARRHQGMDGPGVRQVPEGSGEQAKMLETGCEIICGAPTTLSVKGLMMMMMMMNRTVLALFVSSLLGRLHWPILAV